MLPDERRSASSPPHNKLLPQCCDYFIHTITDSLSFVMNKDFDPRFQKQAPYDQDFFYVVVHEQRPV